MAVVKIIEVVGTSSESWDDAVKNALQGAKETLHGLSGIEVVSQTATVRDGEIEEYRATVKLAFKVD
jgi:flavin-binding protein dodecin